MVAVVVDGIGTRGCGAHDDARRNDICRSRAGRDGQWWAAALLAWLLSAAAHAADVPLAWDPSTNPAVTGYSVYYGTASRSYPNRVVVGNVTSATVTNLVAGERYYFAVTARDSANVESGYSNEVTTVASSVAASTTALASTPNPSVAGASVTFTATVTGSAPTGTVAFRDGATTMAGCGAVALAGTGNTRSATCTTSALVVGSHPVVASYSGSPTNAASTSAALTQAVQSSTTNTLPTVTLTAPSNGASYAIPAILSLAASASDAGGSVTRVEFFAGTTLLGSDTVAPFGLSWNPPAGVHTLTARATDNQGAVSVSPGVVVTVVGVGLASSRNLSRPGETVMLTATVTGNAPDGAVRFHADGASIAGCGAVALAGTGNVRAATCTIATLAEGAHAVGADYAGNASNPSASSPVLSQIVSSQQVWVDEAIPAGAYVGGNEAWTWVGSAPVPFAGARAHRSSTASGLHQHWFDEATQTLTVPAGHALFAYVYLDPASPPSEVMLQWNDGTWEHRAYWGANQIPWGVDGTASRRYMGPLPPAGQWVRLQVPAALVGLEGRTLKGMAFTLYGGGATWDYAGSAPIDETVWVNDALPAGARAGDDEPWTWVSSGPAPFAGTRAHQSGIASGVHQHWFAGATATLPVDAGDVLFANVYLDPANPPSQVMLQWHDGTWEHRAYWGANRIAWGADGTASRRYMGPLPAAGRWVRLEVPAAQVGLERRTLNGMAFTLYGGRATWDYAGVSGSP